MRPGSIRIRSGDLAATPAVLVASERLDEDWGWHPLNTGKLLHVGLDLQPRISTLLDTPPVHALTLAELGEQAARSQQPTLASPWRSCQEQPMDVVDRDTGCGTPVPKVDRLPGYPPTTSLDSPD